jgi:hypothetical protein
MASAEKYSGPLRFRLRQVLLYILYSEASNYDAVFFHNYNVWRPQRANGAVSICRITLQAKLLREIQTGSDILHTLTQPVGLCRIPAPSSPTHIPDSNLKPRYLSRYSDGLDGSVSIPGRARSPDRLWGPPNLLHNGYRRLLSRG